MSESLKELVHTGTFETLQDKLEGWLDNFKYNTCDQNVALGCEIIELNAKMQGQLFKLLSLCASEGGTYGGASAIKTRLLPILGQGFFSTDSDYRCSSPLLFDSAKTKKSSKHVKKTPVKTKGDLQNDLDETTMENLSLRRKLEETKLELDRQGRRSASEKMFDKHEIEDLRGRLDNIKDENVHLKSKALLTDTYQHEVEHLKEDVAILASHRSHHGHHSPRCLSPCDPFHGIHDPCHNVHDPCHHSGCSLDCCYLHVDHCDPLCHAKEQHLVSKFNDLFSSSRIAAMNTLTIYSDDHDNNQKIIFHSVMESFGAAKSAFRAYKSKVRSDLIGHHSSCSLEDSVQHYINNHADHEIDVTTISREVVKSLDFKVPLIRRPPGLSFDLIGSFIREACRIAWSMTSLPKPIDVYHPTSEGELFDDTRYRRSYDSDYNAAFVSHHIWPCLSRNGLAIAKGEALTIRAGSSRMKSSRSGHSPSRSPTRLSGSSPSPRQRSGSPNRFRSKSPISKRHF